MRTIAQLVALFAVLLVFIGMATSSPLSPNSPDIQTRMQSYESPFSSERQAVVPWSKHSPARILPVLPSAVDVATVEDRVPSGDASVRTFSRLPKATELTGQIIHTHTYKIKTPSFDEICKVRLDTIRWFQRKTPCPPFLFFLQIKHVPSAS
uniref:Uncharacterized protein n=1 Tax=Anopheles funestus TaxID=62324 RepID=A0A182RC31_ANOFN